MQSERNNTAPSEESSADRVPKNDPDRVAEAWREVENRKERLQLTETGIERAPYEKPTTHITDISAQADAEKEWPQIRSRLIAAWTRIFTPEAEIKKRLQEIREGMGLPPEEN